MQRTIKRAVKVLRYSPAQLLANCSQGGLPGALTQAAAAHGPLGSQAYKYLGISWRGWNDAKA